MSIVNDTSNGGSKPSSLTEQMITSAQTYKARRIFHQDGVWSIATWVKFDDGSSTASHGIVGTSLGTSSYGFNLRMSSLARACRRCHHLNVLHHLCQRRSSMAQHKLAPYRICQRRKNSEAVSGWNPGRYAKLAALATAGQQTFCPVCLGRMTMVPAVLLGSWTGEWMTFACFVVHCLRRRLAGSHPKEASPAHTYRKGLGMKRHFFCQRLRKTMVTLAMLAISRQSTTVTLK